MVSHVIDYSNQDTTESGWTPQTLPELFPVGSKSLMSAHFQAWYEEFAADA